MCWPEVCVLEDGRSCHALATGPHRPAVPELDGRAVARIAPEDLHAQLKAGEAVVIDTASSLIYRDEGHIPGAWWAIRSRLPIALRRLPSAKRYVLTGTHGRLARLAAGDLDRKSVV